MQESRYAGFDRCGFAHPSFMPGPKDVGLVVYVKVVVGGREYWWPMLTPKGRKQYERDHDGRRPEGGWKRSRDILPSYPPPSYADWLRADR